jgi:uncharacterized protein YegP (UPF0339 family)
VAARFEILKTAAGQYWFVLKTNGEAIVASTSYPTKAATLNAVAAVQSTAALATIEDKTGEI